MWSGARGRARRLGSGASGSGDRRASRRTGDALDVLVNAAGIGSSGPTSRGPVIGIAEKDWDRILDVNLLGDGLLCPGGGAAHDAQRSGRIVNVASIAGAIRGSTAPPTVVSKAGVRHVHEVPGPGAARHGITVNAVAPGPIDTPMLGPEGRSAGTRARFVAGSPEIFRLGVPLGKLGKPEDVASAIVYSCPRRRTTSRGPSSTSTAWRSSPEGRTRRCRVGTGRCLITGAAVGHRPRRAETFARQGARVAVADRQSGQRGGDGSGDPSGRGRGDRLRGRREPARVGRCHGGGSASGVRAHPRARQQRRHRAALDVHRRRRGGGVAAACST